LKKNEEDGIIFRTKSKIVKNKKRQNVFFLTDNGVVIANEIKKIIRESN
jgi:DNA-binding PadR family transcriptional regulator